MKQHQSNNRSNQLNPNNAAFWRSRGRVGEPGKPASKNSVGSASSSNVPTKGQAKK